MTRKQIFNAAAAVAAFVAIVLGGMLFSSPRVRADDRGHGNDNDIDSLKSKVETGLQLSPVRLRYSPIDAERTLVGLGSYIVNAQGGCNDCHFSPESTEYVIPTGMPYFLKPPKVKTQVNPVGYLGGGVDFGEFPGPGPWGSGPFPHIFTRNLTPDISGKPEGGNSLKDFLTIFRTGHDFDGIHPTCGAGGLDGKCVPAPFDGSLLQIMPWPIYGNMSDFELTAIYEFLKAIPCVSHAGTPGLPAILYQTCPLQP